MLDALLERLRQHDRQALARLLTLTARGHLGADQLARLGPTAKASKVVAITGSAGVGKSTLVGKLIAWLRPQGQTVAVLACDPQSPLSGGALLGDRFRMPAQPDDGVFIRSLAAAGGQGALAQHIPAMIRLLEAFGFDVILIETVGAGQGDTAVHGLADAVVLLLQPETGDDLQWEKAGVLEIADIIVIHKADLPGADAVEGQVRATLALASGPAIPVLRVSSRSGQGLEQLGQALIAVVPRPHRAAEGEELLRLAQHALADWFHQTARTNEPADWQHLLRAWQSGDISSTQAAARLLALAASQTQSAR
ncbi:MAG: ArgK/MeaB family GTPase [Gemmataceae bacterium]